MKNKSGFSLIEMILYVAVVSIFISGAVLYAWQAVYGRIKSQVQLDVNYNLNIITSRINYELRNALNVYSLNTSDLCLQVADTAHNPTRLYLSNGEFRVSWGGGSNNCTGMTNDESLSSSSVDVIGLTFVDLSSALNESKNISYSVTVDSVNPSARQEWDKTQTYSSSVELRSN
jgi:prepilin-type N-terminal cleavage/methylation domain-containing protein